VGNASEGATALLGMEGLNVVGHEVVGDECHLRVETPAEVVGCALCGARAVGSGRRCVHVRDLPVAGRPVVLVWARRLWRCGDPDCAARTWSEVHPDIARRSVLTRRARTEICRRVGAEEDSVAEVARALAGGLGHGHGRRAQRGRAARR